MSLQSAIDIYTAQGFSSPQKAVEYIQKAGTLEELTQIMREEHTHLSANQFVHFRISALYKGDQGFAEMTLNSGRAEFKKYGFPEEVIDFYISNGGGIDTTHAMVWKIQEGELPPVADIEKLDLFRKEADNYLLKALRDYVMN